MNLYSKYGDAYDSGITKFLRSKSFMRIYILPVKCLHREFFTVLTEKEIAMLKLKINGDCRVIGASEDEEATWKENQEKLNDPKIKKHDEMIRYLNAEQRAELMRNKIKKDGVWNDLL